MRLLQVSLRSLFLYSLVLVAVSIPVSWFSLREILNKEVDELLKGQSEQFLKHIKGFEYLDDLETDLQVLDQLSANINIKPGNGQKEVKFETISLFDSVENDVRPFRQLSSNVSIKGKPYLLTIRTSLVDNEDLIVAVGSVQIVLIVLLAAGLLLINRSLSRKLWKPFYKTISWLKAYELDKSEAIRVEKTNITEFDDLNEAIKNLTDRNRKIFSQQKEFIEDASHELQTPLAIFQSKLDILMQHPTLSESSAEIIAELEATSQRMNRLNKSLLLLSKIDNEQFIEKENLNLKSIIDSQLESVRAIADASNVTINSTTDHYILSANRTLIEVLIANLLHNAVRHTPSNGTITVLLTEKRFEISNSGKPLTIDPESIFERFKKNSTSSDSSGLGLAIAKKICDTYKYSLKYRYQPDRHIFSVDF